MKTKHTNDYHECKICKLRYVTLGYLAEHTKNIHENESMIYQCEYCPFNTRFQMSFKSHVTKKHSQGAETKGQGDHHFSILQNAIVE